MTIANLGIAVDSSQAKTASSDLDKLAASSKQAEAAANALAGAGAKSGSQIGSISSAAKTVSSDLDKLTASTKTAEKAAGQLASATKSGAEAVGLARHELVNLSRQAQDVFVGLTSGQSFGTVLIQQGTQIADVFSNSNGTVKGFFGQVLSGVATVLTPMRLLAGTTLALGAGALYLANSWSDSEMQVKRALIGIGAASGSTVADINNFVKANSSATGLTVGEAQDAAIQFVKTGNIAVQGLKGVGDAIHGYAILTGQDATDATKAFAEALSGDLVKGAQQINQTYGTMNSATLEYIRTLQIQGDRTGAAQVIIDSIRKANLDAADSVGTLTKAYQAFIGVMSKIKNGPGAGPAVSPQDQLATLQAQRDAAVRSGTTTGRNANGELVQFASNAELVGNLDNKIGELQKNIDNVNTGRITAQLDKLSTASFDVVQSIIPQVAQISKLKENLDTLRASQNTPGAEAPKYADETTRAIDVQTRMLEGQIEANDRINVKTLEIAGNYKEYSVQVAKTVDAYKSQLTVAQAVTGQEKLAAQEAATRRSLEVDQGIAPDKGGAAIAALQRAQAEAQIKSQLEGQLLAMQDQLAVAQAVTGQQQLTAQADATRNAILRDIGDATLANAAADMQREIAEARINSQIENQITGLDQQRRMINAVANGTEASTAAAIAYENAIRAGASATEAAALASATLAANTAKAAAASYQASQAAHYASGGPQEFGNQFGNQEVGLPGTSGTDLQQSIWKANYGAGGYNTFINGGFGINGGSFTVNAIPNDQGLQYMYAQTLNNAAMSQMDAVTKAKFQAGSYQISHDQAEAIANTFLQQNNHSTDANAQKAAADFISRSGSPSSGGTSNSLINPMYTSGSSSVIGFHAANGIDFTVPGTGPTDSVRVDGRVSPGERLIVVPPGGQVPGDQMPSISALMSKAMARANINQRITIQAASLRGASDTMPQLVARLARAAAAAARHR